jgi:UDP-glucose 4-epimerase
VARELLGRDYAVTVLDDLSGGFRENVPAGAEFVQGSVTDTQRVNAVFARRQVDFVFHLAAYAAEGLSHFIRRFNYTNNVIGSVNLINAAVTHDARCFVFTSSIAVYGAAQAPMSEDTVPRPEDPYGIAKYAVELDLAAARRLFGLPYVIFRPHNVYGESQNIGDRYRNVIGIFMNQIMQGRPMTVFGDGEQTRAFTYIGDVAPVIADAIERPEAWGEVFNVGADTPSTVNRLAAVVAAAMGVKGETAHLEARKEVVHAFSSHEKARRVFGRSARWSLEEGVARMAAWARAAGARTSTAFGEIEVSRGLPASWRA